MINEDQPDTRNTAADVVKHCFTALAVIALIGTIVLVSAVIALAFK